jgi:excisionase family DNA binding protein
MVNMKKRAFTTSEIAELCHHSRETVKRWLEKGEIKGYRVGTSGHWRVMPKDLAMFLKNNNIPFPEPGETGIDLRSFIDIENLEFCWEFYKRRMNDHIRSDAQCEDCLVYKVKSINCYALRQEVGHKQIHCYYSCEECAYLNFQRKEILPEI